MALRYKVNGAGDNVWTNTNYWSATSGGAGGASVPTSADDVIFDNNAGGDFKVDTAAVCKTFTMTTGFSHVLYQDGTAYRSITVSGKMQLAGNGTQNFKMGDWSGNNMSITCQEFEALASARFEMGPNNDAGQSIACSGSFTIHASATVLARHASYAVYLTGTGNFSNPTYGNGFLCPVLLTTTAVITLTGNIRCFNKTTLQNGARLNFASQTWYQRGSGAMWEDNNASNTISQTAGLLIFEMTGDITLDFGGRDYANLNMTFTCTSASQTFKLLDSVYGIGIASFDGGASARVVTLDMDLYIFKAVNIQLGASYNSSIGKIDFTLSSAGYGLVQATSGGITVNTAGSGIKFHTSSPSAWNNMVSSEGGNITIPNGILQTGTGTIRVIGWFATLTHNLSGCTIAFLDFLYVNGSTQIFSTAWTSVGTFTFEPDFGGNTTFRFKNGLTYPIGTIVHVWSVGLGDMVIDTDSAGVQATWNLTNPATLVHMRVKDNNLITSAILVNDGTSIDNGNNSALWIFTSGNDVIFAGIQRGIFVGIAK